MQKGWIGALLAVVVAGCGGAEAMGDGGPPGSVDSGAGVDAALGSDAALPPDAGRPDSSVPPSTSDPGDATASTGTSTSHDVRSGDVTIPLTIYLPASTAPAPVVVFHHGFQLGPDDYASYGEHLASWGYVVVLPQMPGGLFGGPTHRDLADHLGAVLDAIVAGEGPLAGRVDASRIGLAGHSLGGKISLLTAASDARVRAVFGVDPVDAGGGPLGGSAEDYPSVTPERMTDISVPIVLLGETTNASCSGLGCMPCAPEADNFHQFWAHASGPALEIEVLGASHMSFLDDPECGFTCSVCSAGTDDTALTRRLTRRYMTAFFEVVLRGEAGYGDYLSGAAMAADTSAGLVSAQAKNGF